MSQETPPSSDIVSQKSPTKDDNKAASLLDAIPIDLTKMLSLIFMVWFIIAFILMSYRIFIVSVYTSESNSQINNNTDKQPATVLEQFGQIGDSFGILNSLFSAFAFAGVLYTIKMQQNEIQKNQKKLEDEANFRSSEYRMNALVALAHHAQIAYQRAIELKAKQVDIIQLVTIYQNNVNQLGDILKKEKEQLVSDIASIERKSYPYPIEVTINSVEFAPEFMNQFRPGSYTTSIQINFEISLRNLTKEKITLNHLGINFSFFNSGFVSTNGLHEVILQPDESVNSTFVFNEVHEQGVAYYNFDVKLHSFCFVLNLSLESITIPLNIKKSLIIRSAL